MPRASAGSPTACIGRRVPGRGRRHLWWRSIAACAGATTFGSRAMRRAPRSMAASRRSRRSSPAWSRPGRSPVWPARSRSRPRPAGCRRASRPDTASWRSWSPGWPAADRSAIGIVALLYAGLLNGGFSLQVSGIPPAIGTILQAMLLLGVAGHGRARPLPHPPGRDGRGARDEHRAAARGRAGRRHADAVRGAGRAAGGALGRAQPRPRGHHADRRGQRLRRDPGIRLGLGRHRRRAGRRRAVRSRLRVPGRHSAPRSGGHRPRLHHPRRRPVGVHRQAVRGHGAARDGADARPGRARAICRFLGHVLFSPGRAGLRRARAHGC